jgi:2-dehydro-3-deoxygluconokinase
MLATMLEEPSVPEREISQSNGVFDVATIGETLAAFISDGAPDRFMVTAAGAESNVAVAMAQVGCKTRWISRLGEDALGRLVHDCIARHGVDVRIEWDADDPTGILVKEIGRERTRVRYYRSQSAARGLGEAHARDLGSARWVHVTGITPALSPTAAAVVAAVLERRMPLAGRISFDVNYRASLWPDATTAAATLVDLARQADVVFIGDDEAQALLGTSDGRDVAAALLVRDDQEIVIKRGPDRATVVARAGEVDEPALAATVVDATGAGDAFAAGYLAAACWGWDRAERLRLGHYLAARVVTVRGDLVAALDREELSRLPTTIRRPAQR